MGHPAGPGGDGLGSVGVPVRDVHEGPGPGERLGGGPSDAAAATGDQGGAPAEVHGAGGPRRGTGRCVKLARHGRKR